MLTFSEADAVAWVQMYLWPLLRIGAAVTAMPVIGGQAVPVRLRAGLALLLTLLIAPTLPPTAALDPLGVVAMQMALQQILIGLALGFVMQVLFAVFVHAGQIIAMQMGLGFAAMVDPQNGVQVPMLGQFYAILVTLVYLGIDGHLRMIAALMESFTLLPIAAAGLSGDALWHLAQWFGAIFVAATSVALPVVTALLVGNLAFGVMSRAAPQLNVFSIGFPLGLLFGFLVILLTIAGTVGNVEGLFEQGFLSVEAFARLGARP
jgi:flagellar biosynthetic protein FliR